MKGDSVFRITTDTIERTIAYGTSFRIPRDSSDTALTLLLFQVLDFHTVLLVSLPARQRCKTWATQLLLLPLLRIPRFETFLLILLRDAILAKLVGLSFVKSRWIHLFVSKRLSLRVRKGVLKVTRPHPMVRHGMALDLPLSTIYLVKYSIPDYEFLKSSMAK